MQFHSWCAIFSILRNSIFRFELSRFIRSIITTLSKVVINTPGVLIFLPDSIFHFQFGVSFIGYCVIFSFTCVLCYIQFCVLLSVSFIHLRKKEPVSASRLALALALALVSTLKNFYKFCQGNICGGVFFQQSCYPSWEFSKKLFRAFIVFASSCFYKSDSRGIFSEIFLICRPPTY